MSRRRVSQSRSACSVTRQTDRRRKSIVRNLARFVSSKVAERLLDEFDMPQHIHSQSDDRRDIALRDALLARLRREIRHVPGLALTSEQASRLFDVPPDVCPRLLASLAELGVIHIRPDGRFIAKG